MILLSRLLVLAIGAAMVPLLLAPPATAAPTTTTSVTMTSESGDWVGGGTSRLWRTGSGVIDVGGSVESGSVRVSVAGGASGTQFSLEFEAAPGEPLTVGQYDGAQRAPFQSAGRPGIDISGDGRGCNTISGRFTVLELAVDLSRLWIVYEQHCEGGEPALFGEVRINMPGGDSDLMVVPGRIAWPDEYPGVNGRIVPVTLVNTGTQPVSVTGVGISSGAADFDLVGNSCTTIEVNASCPVYVTFNPDTPGAHAGSLTVTDSTPQGSHSVALSGHGIPGTTAWTMTGQPGDYIAGGKTYSYTPSTAIITGRGNESWVRFAVTSGDDNWSANFEADSGHLLLPGTTFTGATRYPFNSTSTPGIDVSGNGRGCNQIQGSFTVHEASYYEGGALKTFKVSFEQHCEGAAAALNGTISWRAEGPAGPPPVDETPPAAVAALDAYPMVGSVALRWQDPSTEDWAETAVRVNPGLVAPASIDDGELVYLGRDGGVLVDGLAPGTAYTFAAFSKDASGNVAAGATLTVRASDLSLTATPAQVYFGGRTFLGGRLVDDSGAPLVNRAVRLYTRPRGTLPWTFSEVLSTGTDGGFGTTVTPTRNSEYRVVFRGPEHLGSIAGPVAVTVAPRVSLTANRTAGAVGTRFTLSTSVAPNAAGRTVVLQRYSQGSWRAVRSAVLGTTSRATFSITPASRGTFRYRVRIAASSTLTSGTSRTVSLTVR